MTYKIVTSLLLASALSGCAAGQDESTDIVSWPGCGAVDFYPDVSWTTAAIPSDWNVRQLEQARSLFAVSEADSVMIVHRGNVIAEWGAVSDPVTIQSMRKPILGLVIAQMVADGLIDPDASLADLGIIDSNPPLTEAEQQATFRELLQIRSGIMHDANYEVGSWREIRLWIRDNVPLEERRGRWFYNNWDFNALGTIVARAGDDDLGSIVERYVAEPLGMQDFDPDTVSYSGRDSLAQQHFDYGSDYPAYMFEMSTRDMARFGLLYLGCGNWDGAQLVSEDWVSESLTGIDTYRDLPEGADTGFDQYGYLFWIENGGENPRFPGLTDLQPFYGASGYRGHYTLILPQHDLVIVHQPRTVGGISDEAQIYRARNGSPEVGEEEFQLLVRAIIAAHPDSQ
jgi:CubicO group peptidase (beta-lactamase class C family)